VFNVQNADFSFESGGAADLCWLGFTSLLGAAALHPSAGWRPSSDRRCDRDAAAVAPVGDGARRALHVAALVAVPAGHVVWGSADDTTTTVAAGALALGLVVWRTFGTRSVTARSVAPLGAVANA
jgi:hypothetical protein